MDIEKIKKLNVDYYSELVSEHGDNLNSVGQTNRSQAKRFKKIYEIGDWKNKTVLDVGCGLGSFYDFLQAKGVNIDYTGFDVTPAMINIAKEKHLSNADQFHVCDILTEEVNKRYDYVVSIGALNLPFGNDNDNIMRKFISRMYKICNIGIAVSMTSSLTQKPSKDTYYYDCTNILSAIVKLSQNIRLDHSYLPHDFTIFCYRKSLYNN